ncbi:hypothetical protein ABLE93_09830 [Xanthobacter sp. KR7-65]|uniref:hypothetical protein n=1 Tax=Xanthobacter sp. KR7-65 TaxID=3156612 RepID=UPI0032B3E0A0
MLNILEAPGTASGQSPVSGTFTAVGTSSTFSPIPGRGFNLSIWGTFVGTLVLERSFDGGTTWLSLTAAGVLISTFNGAASEIFEEPEYNVQYRLRCAAYGSGTVNYRVSQ